MGREVHGIGGRAGLVRDNAEFAAGLGQREDLAYEIFFARSEDPGRAQDEQPVQIEPQEDLVPGQFALAVDALRTRQVFFVIGLVLGPAVHEIRAVMGKPNPGLAANLAQKRRKIAV